MLNMEIWESEGMAGDGGDHAREMLREVVDQKIIKIHIFFVWDEDFWGKTVKFVRMMMHLNDIKR